MKDFWKLILLTLTGSLVMTLSHIIPFNIPMLLLWVPVTYVFPQLASNGPEVTYGFAWIQIHANWVWGVLFLWHFIILFIPALLIYLLRSHRVV